MLENTKVKVAFLQSDYSMSDLEKDEWVNKCRRLGLCDIYNLPNYFSGRLTVAISSDKQLDWMSIESLLLDLGKLYDIIRDNPNRITISEFDMDMSSNFPRFINIIRYDTETDSHTAYCYGSSEIKIIAMNTGAIDELINGIERINILSLNLDVNNKMHLNESVYSIIDEDKTFYYYMNEIDQQVKVYKEDLRIVKTKFNESNSQIHFELIFTNDVGEFSKDMRDLLLSHMREYIEGKFNQINMLKNEFKRIKVS